MTDTDPVAASQEASRLQPANEHSGNTPRQDRLDEERGGRAREANEAERGRAADARAARGAGDAERVRETPRGERVDIEADFPPPSDRVPKNPDEARELARETRERMESEPHRARNAVRDTADEPGPTRISRAIDALN